MEDNFNYKKYLAEGRLLKEAYNLPDSDSTTDKYVNNHWDGILKDILRAHTDLRNSKGGESIPERPSQLDIDIVLGRFDGANEFMDVDPNEYNEYFDFYDMYLVTQRDEENTKDISVEDYPEGDYSGYTKRDDLPKLDEGKLLKEAFYPEFKGETNDKINDIAIAVVDELESKLDSESSGILKGMDYYVGSDGRDNDEVEQGFTKWFIDLVKYLSKNNNEVTISSVEQDGKVFTPAITLKYLDNGKEDISWKIK